MIAPFAPSTDPRKRDTGDMDDIPDFQCPECNAIFNVVFHYAPETMGGAQNCPFCGEPMTYDECLFNPSEGDDQ